MTGGSANGQADPPPRTNEKPRSGSPTQNNPRYKWPTHPVQGVQGFNPNYQASASNQNTRFLGSGVPSEFFGNNLPASTSEPAGGQDCGTDTYKKFVFTCLYNNASSLLEADMSFPTKLEEVKKSCS